MPLFEKCSKGPISPGAPKAAPGVFFSFFESLALPGFAPNSKCKNTHLVHKPPSYWKYATLNSPFCKRHLITPSSLVHLKPSGSSFSFSPDCLGGLSTRTSRRSSPAQVRRLPTPGSHSGWSPSSLRRALRASEASAESSGAEAGVARMRDRSRPVLKQLRERRDGGFVRECDGIWTYALRVAREEVFFQGHSWLHREKKFRQIDPDPVA